MLFRNFDSMKLKIKTTIAASGTGYYQLNERTAPHGAIIFSNSDEAEISNCFRYSCGMDDYGYMDFYIRMDTATLSSIWMVSLKSQIRCFSDGLKFEHKKGNEIPFFDIAPFLDDNTSMFMPSSRIEAALEVYFNTDIIQASFGGIDHIIQINPCIQILVDDDNCLSGVKFSQDKLVPRLIELLD
jgi:hypothetical protein